MPTKINDSTAIMMDRYTAMYKW